MRFSDLLTMSVNNLFRRKLRTFLTVLGVVIGTASIVVMVSIGIGLKEFTIKQYSSYGSLTAIQVYNYNNGNSSDKIYACIRGNKLCVVTCRDSKERYYSTTAEKYAYGRTVYKTYTMSKSNYVKTARKYKYCKRIKFQKVR